MNEYHELLKKQAMEAITKLFSDRTVPKIHTADSLREIRDELDIMIDTLDQDTIS